MIMADVLLWALGIGAGFLVVNAYWLLAAALAPGWTERCREVYAARPGRATAVGALTFFPLLVLAAALGKAPNGMVKLVALVLALLVALGALIGSAGLAARVGAGLPSGRDEAEPWRRVWRGGVVLGATWLLPLVGWFLVMPWTLVSGFGALLLARPRRVRASAVTTEPAAMASVAAPGEVPPPLPNNLAA